jgi:hypothetical protein
MGEKKDESIIMPNKNKTPEELQVKSVAKYNPEEHANAKYEDTFIEKTKRAYRTTLGGQRKSKLSVPKWVNVGYTKEGKPIKVQTGRQDIGDIYTREPKLAKNFQEVFDSTEADTASKIAQYESRKRGEIKADVKKRGHAARIAYATDKAQKRGIFGERKWEQGPTEVSAKREYASSARAIRKGAGAISAFLTKRKYNRSPNWFATRRTQGGGYRNPRQYSTYTRTQRVVNPGSYGTTKFEVGSPRNIQQMVNFVEARPTQPIMNMAGVRQSVSDVVNRPTNQYRDVKVSSFKSADELLSFGPKKRVAPPIQIPNSYAPQQYQSAPQQTNGLEFMKRRKIKWY